jgi:ligand-binding sensor domain-containing protein/two-component sensor histidine kinase
VYGAAAIVRRNCFVFLLGLLPIIARTPAVEVAERDDLLTGYSLASWNDADGRPLGSVYAVVQATDGYLWVGSDAGLFRFDGSRFAPWESIGDKALPSAPVRALFEDRQGTLWVGLADGSIHRIRDTRLQPAIAPPDSAGMVSDFTQDADGVIWTVTDRVLYRWRQDEWERVPLPWPDQPGVVLQPYVSRSGDLWVGTRWGVFRRPAGKEPFELRSRDYVFSTSEDTAGRIWTTDIARGFKRLGDPARIDHDLEGAGYRLIHDRRGNLWVATFGKGLWHVPAAPAPPIVRRLTRRSGLFSDSVQALTQDRDGNIWFGTTGGLHRLTERALTPLDNLGFVVAIEMGRDGHVWGGTSNGVVRFSDRPTELAPITVGSRGLDVRALFSEPDGPLWVGTTEGLWRLDGRRLTHVPLRPRPRMQVLSITPDPQGGLWLGDGSRLHHWDGTTVTPFTTLDGAANQRVTVARTDSRGRLWMGLSGGRLAMRDRAGAFRVLDASDGLPDRTHGTISAIFEDDAGTVWIGGSGGLSRYSEGRITTLPAEPAFPGQRVFAIVEDGSQHLWVTVDRGVIRVAKDEVNRSLDDRTHRLSYRLFDTLDGVAGAAVGVVGSLRARDGSLYFVRGGGVTVVNPDHERVDLQPRAAAPVRIESVIANDQGLAPDRDAVLEAGTSRLQINYTALALTAPNNVRFRYRLDGLDGDWIEAGSRRTAFYTNLSPGTYAFHVEATAGEGSPYGSAALWRFTVQPTFYQTAGFYVGCALLLGVLLWGAWRFRMKLVERQFAVALAERVRLSREIHDTLLQGFVGVALQLNAVSDSPETTGGVRQHLVAIRRHVEAYIREARQAIWDLRTSQLETRDLFSLLKEFGRRAVTNSATRFTATVTGTARVVPPTVQHQLLRIGQEAIVNAVRHASASRIHMDLAYEDATAVLRIADDGRGLCERLTDAQPHYGLTTMRERAEELGGRLHVSTEAGRGTVIEARVPVPSVPVPDQP